MDFSLTAEQAHLRKEIIRFAESELNGDIVLRDEEQEFSTEGWKKCAAVGIQGLPIPQEFGGSGADPLTIMLAMEALGYGCRDNGLIFSINAQLWSCVTPIVRFGPRSRSGSTSRA